MESESSDVDESTREVLRKFIEKVPISHSPYPTPVNPRKSRISRKSRLSLRKSSIMESPRTLLKKVREEKAMRRSSVVHIEDQMFLSRRKSSMLVKKINTLDSAIENKDDENDVYEFVESPKKGRKKSLKGGTSRKSLAKQTSDPLEGTSATQWKPKFSLPPTAMSESDTSERYPNSPQQIQKPLSKRLLELKNNNLGGQSGFKATNENSNTSVEDNMDFTFHSIESGAMFSDDGKAADISGDNFCHLEVEKDLDKVINIGNLPKVSLDQDVRTRTRNSELCGDNNINLGSESRSRKQNHTEYSSDMEESRKKTNDERKSRSSKVNNEQKSSSIRHDKLLPDDGNSGKSSKQQRITDMLAPGLIKAASKVKRTLFVESAIPKSLIETSEQTNEDVNVPPVPGDFLQIGSESGVWEMKKSIKGATTERDVEEAMNEDDGKVPSSRRQKHSSENSTKGRVSEKYRNSAGMPSNLFEDTIPNESNEDMGALNKDVSNSNRVALQADIPVSHICSMTDKDLDEIKSVEVKTWLKTLKKSFDKDESGGKSVEDLRASLEHASNLHPSSASSSRGSAHSLKIIPGKSSRSKGRADISKAKDGKSSRSVANTDISKATDGKSSRSVVNTDISKAPDGKSSRSVVNTDISKATDAKSSRSIVNTDISKATDGKSSRSVVNTDISKVVDGKSSESNVNTNISKVVDGKSSKSNVNTDISKVVDGKSSESNVNTDISKVTHAKNSESVKIKSSHSLEKNGGVQLIYHSEDDETVDEYFSRSSRLIKNLNQTLQKGNSFLTQRNNLSPVEAISAHSNGRNGTPEGINTSGNVPSEGKNKLMTSDSSADKSLRKKFRVAAGGGKTHSSPFREGLTEKLLRLPFDVSTLIDEDEEDDNENVLPQQPVAVRSSTSSAASSEGSPEVLNEQKTDGDKIPDSPRNARRKIKRNQHPAFKQISCKLLQKVIYNFARNKPRSVAMAMLQEKLTTNWVSTLDTLQSFAEHAGRNDIQMADFELFLFRLGLIKDRNSMNALIEQYLPYELRRQLIPMAIVGNVLIPKRR